MRSGKEKFDKNGDGRLSGLEYARWYYRKYGHDMEMEERRARSGQSIHLTITVVGSDGPDPENVAADMAKQMNETEAELDALIKDNFSSLGSMSLEELEALQTRFDELGKKLYSFQPRDMDSSEWQRWSEIDERVDKAQMTIEEYVQKIINPD